MEAGDKGTVLLVEDNRKLNDANRRSLELAGYRVTAVETLERKPKGGWVQTGRTSSCWM